MNIILGKDAYEFPRYTFDPNQPKAYTDYLIRRQRIMHQDTNAKQIIYNEMRERAQNKNKKKSYTFQMFQRVLWNVNAKNTGNCKKFGPKWIGPYEIIAIFNEGQNFTLCPINLPQDKLNHPLNQHKLPKRVAHILNNPDSNQSFNVPREQIKPYFPSFEQSFDGIQSPTQLIRNTLSMSILCPSDDPNDDPNDPKYKLKISTAYQRIFRLNQEQINHGYTFHA